MALMVEQAKVVNEGVQRMIKMVEADGPKKAVEVELATGPVVLVEDRLWSKQEEDAYRMRHQS
jgi:hypothetical protein